MEKNKNLVDKIGSKKWLSKQKPRQKYYFFSKRTPFCQKMFR